MGILLFYFFEILGWTFHSKTNNFILTDVVAEKHG
jgi:hypothetical protein